MQQESGDTISGTSSCFLKPRQVEQSEETKKKKLQQQRHKRHSAVSLYRMCHIWNVCVSQLCHGGTEWWVSRRPLPVTAALRSLSNDGIRIYDCSDFRSTSCHTALSAAAYCCGCLSRPADPLFPGAVVRERPFSISSLCLCVRGSVCLLRRSDLIVAPDSSPRLAAQYHSKAAYLPASLR